MKIATWNIERFSKPVEQKKSIIESLKTIDADIVILTETNKIIDLGNSYNCFHSSKLSADFYKSGERRVSIYSKYDLLENCLTFRNDTSICVKLKTPFGVLAVYGTVIGIYGNRRECFNNDLDQQLIDFYRIASTSDFCICGDLNTTFSDNYYYTRIGRQKLNACFDELKLLNTTAGIPENIDHIILTKTFLAKRGIKTEIWNTDKKLSDHIGVAVEVN